MKPGRPPHHHHLIPPSPPHSGTNPQSAPYPWAKRAILLLPLFLQQRLPGTYALSPCPSCPSCPSCPPCPPCPPSLPSLTVSYRAFYSSSSSTAAGTGVDNKQKARGHRQRGAGAVMVDKGKKRKEGREGGRVEDAPLYPLGPCASTTLDNTLPPFLPPCFQAQSNATA